MDELYSINQALINGQVEKAEQLISTIKDSKIKTRAYYRLGIYYLKEENEIVDVTKAEHYLNQAIQEGSVEASISLFDYYWINNTPTNTTKMIDLAYRQVEKGNNIMVERLGKAYFKGRGVKKDLNKAAELLRIAIKNGVSWAKGELIDILWTINTRESLAEMVL